MRSGVSFLIVLTLAVSCLADTFFVDSNGNGDFLKIQSAINASIDGDIIAVGVGVYYENIDFDGKNIILKSSNPEDPNIVANTIIDGGGIDCVVKFTGSETIACELNGFTITNGNAYIGGGVYFRGSYASMSHCIIVNNSVEQAGGGVYHANGNITNCTISNNTSGSDGGGLGHCDGSIINCSITDNTALNRGGGMEECDGVITNCEIFNNIVWYDSGGGLYKCGGNITNCTVSGNLSLYGSGGGVSFSRLIDCLISNNIAVNGGGISGGSAENCTISDNIANDNGGGVSISSNAVYKDCTITGNLARNGGGLYAAGGDIINCTISNNTANSQGGGIYADHGGDPTVTNCIFTENLAKEGGGGMYNWDSESLVINCTFKGNMAKNGGGINNSRNSNSVVSDCVFSSNIANAEGGGIYNAHSDPTVTNCIFTVNSASVSGGGIHNYNNSITKVANCVFVGNSAGLVGGCIWNDDDRLSVSNCILWDNTASSEGNEIFNDSSTPIITYCDIKGGWQDEGNIDTDPMFVDADGTDDILGTEDDNLQLLPGSPCIDAGHNFAVSPNSTDFDGNPRIMDGDNDREAFVDIGVYEYINPSREPILVYVDDNAIGNNNGSSWKDAYNQFSHALNTAQQGDKILVSEGTYYPDTTHFSDPRKATFQMKNGVTVEGGYAGYNTVDPDDRDVEVYKTILSGDIGVTGDVNDNCYSVFYHPESTRVDNTAILDGFMIAYGNANSFHNEYGGGMYNRECHPTVVNCTFIDNTARSGGGMYNYESNPTVTGCIFINNSAYSFHDSSGGGMYNYISSPIVTDCIFDNNWADTEGGGMYVYYKSSPIVTNCIFNGNSVGENGGGMWNYWSSSPTVSSCIFASNSAGDYGGGMYNYGGETFPTISNCSFFENSARYGGGVYNRYVSTPVTNCIFIGNSGSARGGGIYLNRVTDLIVVNCSFGNNRSEDGGAIYVTFNSSGLSFVNCVLNDNGDIPFTVPDQNSFRNCGFSLVDEVACHDTFNNNIVCPDLLLDENMRLLPGSPCIDTGDNLAVDPNSVDLDGNDRIIDGDENGEATVDMGAYEFQIDDPVGLLDMLADDVIKYVQHAGLENSMLVKLDKALREFENGKKNNMTAINSLQAFINAINAQHGKKISENDADELIRSAQQIIDILTSQ